MINYHAFVRSLCKSGEDIVAQFTPERAHIVHMAMGMSGEAGELLDSVKKTVIYNKPIDRENIIEELGDMYWYMTGMMDYLGVTIQDVVEANVDKLRKRYPDAYTDTAAQKRADKQ